MFETRDIAMGIAILVGLKTVIGFGVLSLVSGGLHFLFARPKLDILKSTQGENGFAFSFSWNSGREPAKFDRIKVRLFNPFGNKTQVDVSKEFDAASSTFARDLEMGPGFSELVSAIGSENSLVQIELMALKDSLTHHFEMSGTKFLEKLKSAQGSADGFNEKNKLNYSKPLYQTAKRSFIADPLPKTGKTLKIASNPEFAGEFAAAGGAADGPAVENFAVTKVWIEPGCIVCDACEGIYPEVFEVTADSCIIRPGAPLDNGLLVQEAAEACPVEVIKFTKA